MTRVSKEEVPMSTQDSEPKHTESEVTETTVDPAKESKMDAFAKTSTAAKMSGTFHVTAGLLKRKLGEFKDDPTLKKEGRNQMLLGKVHRFVGTLRGLREGTIHKVEIKRKEAQAVCIKHGGRLLDVASDFVEDMKKVILK